MNANLIYDIYEITDDNDLPDLNLGLALYRESHPGVISHEEDRTIREFIGSHGQELAKAFPDRDAFSKAVEDGVAADKAAEAE